MTEPTQPEVNALAEVLLSARWPGGGFEGMPTRVTAKKIAETVLTPTPEQEATDA